MKSGKLSGEPDMVSPKTDRDFFAIGRALLGHSTCLKTQTAALIVANGKIISWGVNMCCPQDQIYGLPVIECPRMKIVTGADYDFCKPIHAEIVAAINAFGISHIDRKSLWHFPGFTLKLRSYEGFFKNKNAALYLLGHYWACDECVDFLKLIGISEIKFDDLSGGPTLKRYRSLNLTAQRTTSDVDVSGSLLRGAVMVQIRADKINDFCGRHGIDPMRLLRFPAADLSEELATLMICVPASKETDSVHEFAEDADVQAANLLLRE